MQRPPERLPDWPERLFDTIQRHQASPFAWGVCDCGTLFAESVVAVTGCDPREGSTWTSRLGALRFLKTRSVPDMLTFVAERFDEIVPADARRGDVGFAVVRGSLTCPAIITGAEAVSRDDDGWIVMPRALIVRAFKVGR